MPVFVAGDVLETRRGGVDVLRHLAQELATLERHGSIQILRNVPNVGQRIGHLLIYDGTLAAAFHDADAERYGIEALLEIESDAAALDAHVSLHELSEAAYMTTLSEHPSARLIVPEKEARDESWWTTVRAPRRRIDREDRLPELKPSVPVPEALRRKSEARLKNRDGPVLMRGQAWLEHTIEPDEVFQLASILGEMQQPYLVISRQAPTRVEANYSIDMQHYRWLSETEHVNTLEPSLETIRQTIEQFFSEHPSSVFIFEGIEYLSGIHGEARVIEMIRSIVDHVRFEGHVCILSSNLEAFNIQQRARLEREFRKLESSQIQAWLLDIDLLRDHPYFTAMDEEVETALAEHISANLPEPSFEPTTQTQPLVEQIPLPVEHQSMRVDDELRRKMQAWASEEPETVEKNAEIQVVEESERKKESKPAKGPRIPQRIVRKRKYVASTNKQTTIDAAANKNIELPSFHTPTPGKPFVPIPADKKHKLPQPKPSYAQRGMNQAAASTATRKQAQFPPIQAKRKLATSLPIVEQPIEAVEPSPHAREYASVQQTIPDESEQEEDA